MSEWIDFRWRPSNRAYLALLRDESDKALLGVTPLVDDEIRLGFSIGQRSIGALKLRGLLLVGNVPLFPFPSSAEYLSALCNAALAMPSIDCLYMPGVPQDSPFMAFLADVRRADAPWIMYEPGPGADDYLYIETSMSFEDYLKNFKPKTLQEFRRKMRRLEEQIGAKVDLVRVRAPDDVPDFLAAARSIAIHSWQRQLIGLDVDQERDRQEFLEGMARQGVLRAYLLRAGDKNLAYELGFQLNGLLYFHETAFDPHYARFSPGQLLFNLVIQDCFACGKPRRIYYGPGEMPYKRMLANRQAKEVTVVLLRNCAANQTKVAAHRLFKNSIAMIKSRTRDSAALNAASSSSSSYADARCSVDLVER